MQNHLQAEKKLERFLKSEIFLIFWNRELNRSKQEPHRESSAGFCC